MQHRMTSFAVFAIPLLLSGCGGGSGYTNPYDGTWQAASSILKRTSTITDTKTELCDSPPATLAITNGTGTTTQFETCTTTTIDATTKAQTSYPPQITYAIISISIEGKTDINSQDVLNAIVNGVPHTGTCISTIACSAASAAGDVLSLTR